MAVSMSEYTTADSLERATDLMRVVSVQFESTAQQEVVLTQQIHILEHAVVDINVER